MPQARSYCARFLERMSRPSLSSFWRTSASISSPSDDDLAGVDVVADGQLAGGDDALGLEADVEEDLVLVDLDDRALHDVAVVELDDRAGDGVLERDAVEVVGDHLPRRVLTASSATAASIPVVRRWWLLVGLVGHGWGRLLSGQSPAERLVVGKRVTRATRSPRWIVPPALSATRRYSGVLEVGRVGAIGAGRHRPEVLDAQARRRGEQAQLRGV